MSDEALARCVGDPDAFLAEAWEARVHLHRGADAADLLSLDAVDGLLAGAALRAPAFRLVKDGSPIEPSRYLRRARVGSRTITDLIDPGRVHALFADGATVVLQGLQRYWPPLSAFCRALELDLTHPVQANAYLTPPGAAGLNVHADAHDVFALQTYGRKHWTAWERFADLGALGDPVLDDTLVEGDALYVPRDTPHLVRTLDAPSLHITVGIRVHTWRDALARGLADALDDDALDRALPVGWTQDPSGLSGELSHLIEQVTARLAATDRRAALEGLADDFIGERPPLLAGQLREILALEDIDDDTMLRRRAGAICRTTRTSEHVVLILGDRRLTFPAHAWHALRLVERSESFTVRDLSPYLDERGRGVLARRLVAEGLLVRGG